MYITLVYLFWNWINWPLDNDLYQWTNGYQKFKAIPDFSEVILEMRVTSIIKQEEL